MALGKKLSLATTALIALGSLIPTKAFAFSIVSEVFGSLTPPVINAPSLQNGDFLIQSFLSSTLGDGANEFTTWNFDFTQDPNYGLFSSSTKLASAVLTFTLTPRSGYILSDSIGIIGYRGISMAPLSRSIPQWGQTGTITLDLLRYWGGSLREVFTSQEIINILISKNGVIPWIYQDDALISFARLELTSVPEPVVSEPVVSEPVVSEPVVSEPVVSEPVVSEPVVSPKSVPEPASTLGLLALGVFGAAAGFKRQQKSTISTISKS